MIVIVIASVMLCIGYLVASISQLGCANPTRVRFSSSLSVLWNHRITENALTDSNSVWGNIVLIPSCELTWIVCYRTEALNNITYLIIHLSFFNVCHLTDLFIYLLTNLRTNILKYY